MSFKDMKISRKLTVGFGILVILILILGGSSFWGFSTYREIARDNVLMGRVQANLLEARLQVKNFIQTNDEASVTEFNNRFTTLNEIMANAQTSINNPTRAEKVDFIDENLDTYEETFGEVVEYFKQRQVFVDDNAVKGAKIRENITEIMRTANRDKDPAAAYYAGVLQEHLLLGRLYFYKFLDDNLDEDYERIIEELEEKALPLLDVLDRELQNPTRRKLRQEIVELMPTYISNVEEVKNIITARNALIQNVLDEVGPQVATAAEDVKLDIKAEQDTLGPMVTIIIIVVAIVAIILAIFVTRLITAAIAKPINRAVEAADKISAGDLKVDLKSDAHDETGLLLSAMDTMTDNVESLLDETNRLITATKKGQLDVRGDSSKYKGAWFDLINGVNDLVDAFVGPINVTAEYVDRVSKGDIPPKITDDYQGDFNEIKNNLNNLIDVMGGLLQETNVIIKNVDQGKLDYRADSGQFIGGWGELVGGINNIIDSFVGPINVTAEYIDRVSKGDIPPKITDEYQGDFNEIKNNLNNQIDVMNGLLLETDQVIDAVKQGKLDFRANSGQFIAKWGELVGGINEIVDAFVAPVNVTAEYVDRVSKGDIPPKITDDYQGDFNEIKNNLNQLIDILNLFVSDMKYMSKQHDLGDIDVKIDESKFTGAYNEMASGVNKMVFGHISVKKKAISVFEEYGNGNFAANMERLPGKKVFINEAIDNVQNNLKNFGDEIKALVEFAKKGQLEKRGDASKFRGDWAKMVDGANDLIDAFFTPLNEAGEVLSIMATGDLTTKMKGNYQGYLQKFKNDINTLGDSLTNLISEVSETVETTASSALEISSTAESLAAATQEQSSQADEVASAVEEMSRTVTENAMSASKTSEMAQNNGTIATEGGDVVAQTVQKMKDIAKVVKTSAGNIQKLGESSKQIGEIISVIDDIADQTNLLALNAAIEAARAGEQGRGFAVVADEVRKLAERTTDATKKIADMIKGIQKETQEAVVAMNQGTEEVNSGIDLADKAGQSLNTILTSTKDVEDMINQIAAASEEQSATSEQISKNVVSISKVTSESAHRVEDVARTSEDLAKLTEHLKELMSQFKVEGASSYSSGSSMGLESSSNKHLPEATMEDDDIF